MTLVESRYFNKLVGLIIGSVFVAIFYSINESLYVQTSLMTSNSYIPHINPLVHILSIVIIMISTIVFTMYSWHRLVQNY